MMSDYETVKSKFKYLFELYNLPEPKSPHVQIPWGQNPFKGFPYKGIEDEQYKRDRLNLFRKDGKGWEFNPESPMQYQRRRRKERGEIS